MGKKNKALFLDRDGVINVDKHHVYKIEDCEFVPGIFDLCRQAKQKGYLLVVVTNQAGIAKGIIRKRNISSSVIMFMRSLPAKTAPLMRSIIAPITRRERAPMPKCPTGENRPRA